jgi:hypothetical protein
VRATCLRSGTAGGRSAPCRPACAPGGARPLALPYLPDWLPDGTRASRKPRSYPRSDGPLPMRLAARQKEPSLIQLPPRNTRPGPLHKGRRTTPRHCRACRRFPGHWACRSRRGWCAPGTAPCRLRHRDDFRRSWPAWNKARWWVAQGRGGTSTLLWKTPFPDKNTLILPRSASDTARTDVWPALFP